MFGKLLASAAATMLLLGLSQIVGAHGGDCDPDCKTCGKVCKPKTETKKVAKPYYDCKCVPFCPPPKCNLSGGLHKKKDCGDCGGCDECSDCGANCPKPRVKKVLIKKIKTEDECVTTCVIEEGCEAPKCRKKRGCDDSCCPDACGATIIMEGAGPPMTVPGAEPIAPPKNMP